MKRAAKVETAVMVTDRSRLPPNIGVQMLEAPPPGEIPVTKRPNLSFELDQGRTEQMGMKRNWLRKPMQGPTGLRSTSFITSRSRAQPMLM